MLVQTCKREAYRGRMIKLIETWRRIYVHINVERFVPKILRNEFEKVVSIDGDAFVQTWTVVEFPTGCKHKISVKNLKNDNNFAAILV